ncbi:Cyclic di-GMP phosphodiesterase response regulator RpfG [Vibrio aerogenes CECT 7868]|uniref:Cyclic di-GMP phosphodiesterase response regulator RpfG n=1 Tax=Vibrio aerogenes CECT 7868 TaxID=1216006 RepID=A0A1M5V8H5_9VIBR|nr:response regulator [Vibrio aerogenes]SHH71559.1 Cyclic di-GMP phosphodiesterase response regulator RpfG [Vibrio aerogenes CECT 7868]
MELFADMRQEPDHKPEIDHTKSVKIKEPWKVLLVDDDPQMHQITQLALGNFSFQKRPLQLISAYSGEEAKEIFQREKNIALALIDVVMETEHAGLDLVRFIRDDYQDRLVRLVLRTGQAGQTPEDKAIQEYEIDDYKEKTELTTQKLRTLLYSMLRSYRDLCLIEQQKEGLSKVIQASANVQNTKTLKNYATSVLQQLTSLIGLEASAFYCIVQPHLDGEMGRAMTIAATGNYVSFYQECSFNVLPDIVAERCKIALKNKHSYDFSDAYVFHMSDDRGIDNLLYVNLVGELSDLDKQLLKIYMQNISLTFDNINLMVDLQETSQELVYHLSNAVEARSKETGAHVQRVALYCERLAQLYGLPDKNVQLIKHASPLHDVGKVAVPDSILHKPGKLDAEEWKIMKKHVDYGVEILSQSKRSLMVVAREIAENHHEKWDGSGYPCQRSGDDIPVSGRIAALADVFDALGAKRCYKEAWGDSEIRDELLAQRGKHFDPKLVDLFLDNWDDFIEIREQHPD